MKTEVIMKRELFGKEISQKSKSEFFSATDLVKAGNSWRISNGLQAFNISKWFQNKAVKEFMAELEEQFGIVKTTPRGRGKHMWVHPFLFIDIALAISPKLKIETYRWLYDELLKYRNSSGDSYKRMCGALLLTQKNATQYKAKISNTALMIRNACGVSDWQTASELQLKLRDRIQDNIAMLCDVLSNNDDAVRIGIKKAIEFESKTL